MKIDKRIFRYIPHVRIYMAALVGLSALAGIAITIQAQLLAHIINAAFLNKQTLTQVASLLIILLAVITVRAGLIWIGDIMENFAATRAKTLLRQRLFAHIMQLGSMYVKGERSGELVNTITEGVESLDAYFSQVLPQLCATILIPTIVLLAVFLTDPLSGIVLLLTLPLLPIFMILIGKQANTATQRRWHILSEMSAHFLDVLQGSTTLKLFGRNHAQQETIRQVSNRFGDTTMGVLRIAFLSALVMELGATISTAIVAVEIGLRLLYGQIPFEPAFFVLLLTPEFYQPLRALGPQFHASMESAAGAQRIFDILDTPTVQFQVATPSLQEPTIQHTLQFNAVHYSYKTDNDKNNATTMKQELNTTQHTSKTFPDNARLALQNITFQARMGQKIAIVGPSGAGKSTIANLLLRFIEPDQGSICVDTTPIQTFTAQDWRKLVAWQPQRPYLFNTTAAENIRLGRSTATIAEVQKAAQQAHIDDFIQTLPQGYDTIIGERGTRLSGGQIQRLSLARAFLKDAPILILDEATSALDTTSETQVLQSLNHLMQGRITILIAHQLRTIRDADQIIVLQAGHIVGIGTHTELQQKSDVYQQLLRAYTEEEEMVLV